MSLRYIRAYYGVPAKRGGRVRYAWIDRASSEGRITGGSYLLSVRFDGDGRTYQFHPTDNRLMYLPDPKAG